MTWVRPCIPLGVFRLLRVERQYRKLLLASLLSGIGTWFNNVALLALLLRLHGGGFAVGVILAARILPNLAIGSVGGVLADTTNRKIILIVTDVARGFLALTFLFVNDPSHIWIAYVATLLMTSFSAVFSPSRTAVIPQLVDEEHIYLANSLEQSVSGFVMALGSALGGIVAAVWGADTCFVLNAVSFAISAVLCTSIRFPNDHCNYAVEGKQKRAVNGRDPTLWEIYRKSRYLWIISLQIFLWPIGGGVINVLMSVYGYQVFHGGSLGVGFLYAALGFGFIGSALFARGLNHRPKLAIVAGYLIEGISQILVSRCMVLFEAALFLVVAGAGAGLGNAAATSLTMQTVPNQVQGRVFGLFSTISSVTMGASMLGTGVLLTHLPPRMVGLVAGFLMVLAACITGIGLLRTLPQVSSSSEFP